MLAIQKYILANGLEKAILEFNLKTRIYENKVLLKYDQLSSPTLMSNKEVQECRGLILEKGSWKVMSLAFTKFFNSEEGNAHKIDWDTAHVLEKLDGSCIQVYWDCDKQEWFAGTTGTAEGEGEVNNKMGTTFNQLFWSVVSEKYDFKKENLNKLFCYVFELTTPYNIVVKPHGESAATLLMARNLVTLEEVPFEALTGIADSLGVPRVKSYDLNAKNVGALLRTFENMVWHDEGYVVVDANFNRVKIKNPAYVAVHHLKGKTAEHNIMTIVKTNEIEEFAATFIDRKKEVFELKSKYDSLIELLEKIKLELVEFLPKNITPKENKRYAEAVFNICDKYRVKGFSGLFFMLKDGKVVSISDYIINYDDKKLYNFLLGR
jgi:hypothetical protein